MGLTIPVILNSVNNLSDARYAAGMGVDLMGFEVEEGAERYVNLDLYKAITAWLSGVQTVASVSLLNPDALAFLQENHQPDFIQFESVEGISQSDLSDIACIQKITVPAGQELAVLKEIKQQMYDEANFILLELSDWTEWKNNTEIIAEVNKHHTILWALPIDKEDIELIQNIRLNGIGLKGGDEQRPGWKDLDELIDILEALEEN
jgi:phosphoribosylanthranilate isomerase